MLIKVKFKASSSICRFKRKVLSKLIQVNLIYMYI